MQKNYKISLILFIACFLVFIMIILGGLTRLTGSGLSIVEWHLISGILPPLSFQEWQLAFKDYQLSPEYLKINKGMTLEEFKHIFWLEYVHRLWGRVIGIYFLIPLFIVWRDRSLRLPYFPLMLFIFFLGAIQGLIGWIMVKSGLVKTPHVSPYYLAAHLILGFFTYGIMLVTAVKLYPKKTLPTVSLPLLPWALALFTCTVFYGALVAGHKAGLVYNTFPLMGGQWVPEDAWNYNPAFVNLFINPSTVQWVHRQLALITLFIIILIIKKGWTKGLTLLQRYGLLAIGFSSIVQFSLGIATLLCQVPTLLAILHQAGALVLFSALLVTWVASNSALSPGRVLPSNHSRKAPPAVER
jgi:cytochrome c oxidase assembly protein subunit 15